MAREKKGKIKITKAKTLPGVSLDDGEGLAVSIGAALGLRENARDGGEKHAPVKPAAAPGESEEDAGAFLAAARQATLHRERARRGGREVTVVSCSPAPSAKQADEIASMMRKGLGCGSRVEDGKVVLQGDLRERAGAWLAKRGVKKVVMGN